MPRNYLLFLMLVFAAVLALVLYDSCHKPKKRYEEIGMVAGQDTIPRATFTIINHDGRQKVKKVWNPALQDSVVWKVWRNEIDTETLYVHTGVEEFDKLVKTKNDTVVLPLESYKSILGVSWFMRVDTLGNITIAYDSSASYLDSRNLKVNLVNGRWEVESALPVRIKLKDGYLENNGDSIEMGFEYGDIANDFDDLVEKVKAKKRRGDSAAVLHYDSEMKKVPALEVKGHVRSVLDPRDYNTVQEWRVPEEIIADQKMLDSYFARLDSVLADTTKKKNND